VLKHLPKEGDRYVDFKARAICKEIAGLKLTLGKETFLPSLLKNLLTQLVYNFSQTDLRRFFHK
jgi:hypothetical protein